MSIGRKAGNPGMFGLIEAGTNAHFTLSEGTPSQPSVKLALSQLSCFREGGPVPLPSTWT